MNKLIKGLAVTGLALATFGATSMTASAAKVRTIPKSMRGTWYDKSSFSKNSEIKFTKYTYTYWYHNRRSEGSLKFKPVGHSSTAKIGRWHGNDFFGRLWTQHSKGSAWYAFSIGDVNDGPAIRRTNSYLYSPKGKKLRLPAIEVSLSHFYGSQDGTTPPNDYYFKAHDWYAK